MNRYNELVSSHFLSAEFPKLQVISLGFVSLLQKAARISHFATK